MTEPNYDPFRSIGPPDEGMLFRPIRPKSKPKSAHKIKRPLPPAGLGEPPAAQPPAKPAAPVPAAESPPKPVPPPQRPVAPVKPAEVSPPVVRQAPPAVVSPPMPQSSPAAPSRPVPTARPPAPVVPAPPTGGEVLGKARFATAEAAARHADLDKPARALLAEGMTPLEYLDTLLKAGHCGDAVQFLAQVMPRTEAVIWGHTCLRQVLGEADKSTNETIAAVGRWLVDRTDDNRRACRAAAEVVGIGSAPGSLAMAAFWSGGSIAPPDANEIEPREHLTGVGVSTALLLAAVRDEPHKAPDKLRTFALQGMQMASGKPA